MVDVNIFNEEHFDAIVRDIIKNIKTKIVRETEIRKIEIYLKKNISKVSYSIPELTNGINNILDEIPKTSFTRRDINNAAKQVKINKAVQENSNNPFENLAGLPVMDQVKAVLNIFIQTIVKILDEFVVLFVSMLIVLNLYYRSNVHSSILYPSNPNAFPYVYFDEKNNSTQRFLTSCIETNTKDNEDDVFLDAPAFFTSDGKYNLNKNVCRINDPLGMSKEGQNAKCTPAYDFGLEESSNFMKKIIPENIDFFAKKFMETNALKNTNDLSIYGMISYIILFSQINTNGSLQGIDSFFKPLFSMGSSKSKIMKNVSFAFFTFVFYILFQNSKNTFASMFEKFLFTGSKTKMLNNYDFVGSFFKLVSGFFAPFMTFFKLIFLMVYPMVLFHSIYGYINYSLYSASLFITLFCYLGVAFSLMLFLSYMTLMIYTIKTKKTNLDEIFSGIIENFMKLVGRSIDKLTKVLSFTNKFTKESFSCNPDKLLGLGFISKMFHTIGMLILTPILIILFSIPNFLTIYITFNTTKSVTVDFLQYIKTLICQLKDYRIMIRAFFYILVAYEITKYMKQKLRFFTIGILSLFIIYDLRYNSLKQLLVSNKCISGEDGVEVGEKLSDFIISGNSE